MADKVGLAILFLSLVAVMVAVGLLLGMLVAGRIDRMTTPRPKPSADDATAEPPVTPAPPAEDDQA